MKKALCTILMVCLLVTSIPLCATASPYVSGFSDVPATAWYKDAVEFVSEKGLMSGIGSGKFGPDGVTTRGQLVTILYRLEGEPYVSNSTSFTDVSASDYYGKAVQWAATNGIVSGVGNGKFSPNDSITREQMVTILHRYSQYKHYELPNWRVCGTHTRITIKLATMRQKP